MIAVHSIVMLYFVYANYFNAATSKRYKFLIVEILMKKKIKFRRQMHKRLQFNAMFTIWNASICFLDSLYRNFVLQYYKETFRT